MWSQGIGYRTNVLFKYSVIESFVSRVFVFCVPQDGGLRQ